MGRQWMIGIVALLAAMSVGKAEAQIPIADIIKQGIKKVIIAVDLKVQRLQNKTIWLQNAQKQLENVLSKAKLNDISGWVEKQKDLYGDYFDELWKVKDAITLYHRTKEIIGKQVMMVNSYKQTYRLFQQDAHFTPDELEYMGKVYTGMMDESLKHFDQLFLVANAMTTQMSDAERINIINAAGDAIDKNYNDMQAFNNENKLLSLHRSKDASEAAVIKALYGLN